MAHGNILGRALVSKGGKLARPHQADLLTKGVDKAILGDAKGCCRALDNAGEELGGHQHAQLHLACTCTLCVTS